MASTRTVQWLRSIAAWRATDQLPLRNTFYVYEALRNYRNVDSYRFHPTNTAVIRSATLRVYAASVNTTMAYPGPPRTADLALRLHD